MNILLVKYRYLGDAILALPAFSSIRQAYPEARINILTEPIVAHLLEGNPWDIRPIVIHNANEVRSLKGLLKFTCKFRKSRYDLSCNFIHEFTIRDSLLPFLSGIPVRAGFSVHRKGFLFSNRVDIEGHQVKLGVEAPRKIEIYREELYERVKGHSFPTINKKKEE